MSTVNEKMTSIADKIRSLTGQTDKLSLDAMNTNLETANTDKETMIATLEELGVNIDANASLSDIASLLPTVAPAAEMSYDETNKRITLINVAIAANTKEG